MITLTESFLEITMNYEGKSGNKGFSFTPGHTHTFNVYSITDSRAVVKDSFSSYSQTATPTSVLRGRKPQSVKISGPLCATWEVPAYLSAITNRNLNTIYNVLLPCSIVMVNSQICPEISGQYWIVTTFKVVRDLSKRDLLRYELVMSRWYEALPT